MFRKIFFILCFVSASAFISNSAEAQWGSPPAEVDCWGYTIGFGYFYFDPCSREDYYVSTNSLVETLFMMSNGSYNPMQLDFNPICDGVHVTSCYVDQSSLVVGAYTANGILFSFITGDSLMYPNDTAVRLDFTYASYASPWYADSLYLPLTIYTIGQPSLYATTFAESWTDWANAGGYFNSSWCEMNCFDAGYSHSTVPFYTMDTPRSLTLMYREERAHPRPIVYAHLSLPVHQMDIAHIEMRALLDSTYVTFTSSGTTTQSFNGISSSWSNRHMVLTAQIDASGYQTGFYPVDVEATITWEDSSTTTLVSTTTLAIVDPNEFKVAPGWSIAGLQRLITSNPAGGYLVVDGDGSWASFGGLNGALWQDNSILTWNGTNYFRTYLDGSKVRFTSTGLMDAAIDPVGRTTKFEYDGSGKLIAVKDPVRIARGDTAGTGRYIELSYGGNGYLSTISDGGGADSARVTTLGFSSNKVTTITDPDSYYTTLAYDDSMRISSVTDRKGGVTNYGYNNASWKLTSTSVPSIPIDNGSGSTSNQTLTTTYSPWHTQYGIPTLGSPGTAVAYSDPQGSVTNPLAQTITFKVNAFGLATKITDPVGYITWIKRYAGIIPSKITYPDWTFDTLVTNGAVISKSKNSSGEWMYYYYDGSNRLTTVNKGNRTIEYRTYNGNGQLDSLWTPTNWAKYTYNATTKQVASITDQNSHRDSIFFDSKTWNTDSTMKQGGRWSRIDFDTYGRPVVTQSIGGPAQIATFDILNRMLTVKAGHDTTKVTMRYNELFRTSVLNQKSDIIDSVEYNALGWVTSRRDPNNNAIQETYRYNKIGQMTGVTTRRLEQITNGYNSLGQLTSHSAPGISSTFSQDFSGDNWNFSNGISSVFNQRFPEIHTDSTVTAIAGGMTMSLLSYQTADTLGATGVVIPLNTSGDTLFGIRRYTTDSLTGQFIYLRIGDADTTRISYGSEGLRDSTFWQGGAIRVESYTNTHARSASEYTSPAGSLSRWYKYNAEGRIYLQAYPGSNKQELFLYDSLGQLVVWERWSGCSSPTSNATLGYWYNSCTTRNDSVGYQYDRTGDRIDNSGSYGTGNRISQFKGYAFTHDSAGQIVRKTKTGVDTRYQWNADNQLIAVIDEIAHDTVKFEYDALGRLTKRRANSTVDRNWVYEGPQILAEFDGSGTLLQSYMYEAGIDRPFAVEISGSGIWFNQLDQQGNVVGQQDGTGSVTAAMNYDPWGVPIDSSGTLKGTLRWKGLHFEGGATIGGKGLYYVRARWYDPELGRFLSEDPLGIDAGYNRYIFAGNDPINGRDPTGLYDDAYNTCRDRLWERYQQGLATVDQYRDPEACRDAAQELEKIIITPVPDIMELTMTLMDRLYGRIPQDVIIDLVQQYIAPYQEAAQAAAEAAKKAAAELAKRVADRTMKCNDNNRLSNQSWIKNAGLQSAVQALEIVGPAVTYFEIADHHILSKYGSKAITKAGGRAAAPVAVISAFVAGYEVSTLAQCALGVIE